jgi:membrane protein implicated in regulation of membrane protease activity
MMKRFVFVLVVTIGVVEPAFAYVGPGAGLSLLGTLWGVLVAILAALGFVVAWPVRRLLRQRRERQRLHREETGTHSSV